MSKILILPVLIVFFISACAAVEQTQSPTSLPVQTEVTSGTGSPELAVRTATGVVSTSPAADDFFTRSGISLPAPVCSDLTPSQMEGPYYKADTPQRNSLMDDGLESERLVLVGYVLDQNCEPLPNAWLDFWQADTTGEYDNIGYRLRGHQYTDVQGRYYLETVLPGQYASRPIEHIHVKIRPEGGEEVTSQLYFPNQPMEGLTVTLEDRGDLQVGYFNFVVPR